MTPTLTTDESILYGMTREQLARHGRAATQMADDAYRSLHHFTVHVLMLPPGTPLATVVSTSSRCGMVDRCRQVITSVRDADEVMRAYNETLRRRGISG